MKKIRLLSLIGMITVIVAFVGMATGAVFSWNWAFFIGAGLLVAGVVLTIVVPGIITAKWNKLMEDHGVPAKAVLLKCIPLPRTNDVQLDFRVDDSEIITSATIAGGKKRDFKIDSEWEIKYDPNNTEFCLVVAEIEKQEADSKQNDKPAADIAGTVNTNISENNIEADSAKTGNSENQNQEETEK